MSPKHLKLAAFLTILACLTAATHSCNNHAHEEDSEPPKKAPTQRKPHEFKHPKFTKAEFGRIGWTVLHMYSAFYPENPTPEDDKDFVQFLHLFGKFFPCKECGGHFMKMIQENHFEGGSRLEAMKYICEMHNIVNKRLKKPIVPCDQIEKMWGQKGCSSCDPMSILKKYQAKLKAEAAAKQTSPAVQSLAAGSLSEATEKVLKISSIHAEQAMLS